MKYLYCIMYKSYLIYYIFSTYTISILFFICFRFMVHMMKLQLWVITSSWSSLNFSHLSGWCWCWSRTLQDLQQTPIWFLFSRLDNVLHDKPSVFTLMRSSLCPLIWGRDGTMMHYGKKTSWQRQSDALGSTLLKPWVLASWMLLWHVSPT